MAKWLDCIGEGSLFALRVLASLFRPPFEIKMLMMQLREIGAQSLLLVIASGLASAPS